MKLVEQKFEVINAPTYEQALQVCELCCRVAYKSEDRIGPGSAEKLLHDVLHRKPTPHESVIEHVGMTLKFTTDRGVTHEWVRHRLASYTQESTRFVNYSKGKFGNTVTVIEPVDMPNEEARQEWCQAMIDSERHYMRMLELGCTPQCARSVLTNSTKAEIMVTTNFRNWRHVFTMRTSKQAHPQMRELMLPALAWCKETYPVFFEGIGE